MDGTLIRSDTLVEGILSILASRRGIAQLPQLLTFNRARLKKLVAELAESAPDLLPYNARLIDYLKEMKRVGRPIVLATAADEHTARAIADHLGIFDDVIASNGRTNLKGKAKARELVRRFGSKGFDYAGNDRSDLAVWREAEGVIIVNTSRSVTEQARAFGRTTAEFHDGPSPTWTMLRAMRPHQWVKNLLVFVPLLTAHAFLDGAAIVSTVICFASFCLAASSIYLINDLMDLKADRGHPRKRLRPFASGALPLTLGMVLAPLLLAVSFALALACGAAPVVATYAGASLAYSLALKRFPLVDVFVLAALYTLRIVAGGAAAKHPVSLWLLAFSGFTFLSLALVKRCAELPRSMAGEARHVMMRRGYTSDDRPVLTMFGVASVFASGVVLALFVGSTAAEQQYSSPELLWALVPLILFWQCRIWLSTERGHMHDDPIVYASRDWVSWTVAATSVAAVVLAAFSPIR